MSTYAVLWLLGLLLIYFATNATIESIANPPTTPLMTFIIAMFFTMGLTMIIVAVVGSFWYFALPMILV